jgi:plastocyanin
VFIGISALHTLPGRPKCELRGEGRDKSPFSGGPMKSRELALLGGSILIFAAGCTAVTAEPTVAEPTEAPTLVPTETPTAVPTEPEPTEIMPSVTPTNPDVSEDGEPELEIEARVVDSAFRDKEISVPVGTTITWIYDASLPHTVTSDDDLFNSGTLSEGETFSFTFAEPGSYPYYCRFHGGPDGQGMSGIIIVTDS